ncbi:MAG: hypothetical protein PHU56_01970 [Candidatus Pacebacteria bacterium]|nr:hypothetical protein [Candidatus Paceibacterota bacterium]
MDEQALFAKIMLRIAAERRKMLLRRKIVGFSLILTVSSAGLIPAVKMAYAGFAGSGFVQLFSLIFSDTAVVMSLWKNFLLSLLETMPITGLVVAGASLLLVLGSLKFLSKSLKGFQNSKQLINIISV